MANIPLDGKTLPAVVTPIVAVDTSIAMWIACISPTATAATVTVDATGITCTRNGVVDTTVGASGVVADATYTTLGAMVDIINLSPHWYARLGCMQRSDLSANTLLAAAATNALRTEYVIYQDSSTISTATLYIHGARITRGNCLNGPLQDAGVINIATRIEGIGSSAGAHTLAVYSCNELTKVDTLLWKAPLTTATAYEFNDVDFGATGGLWSKPGESLLIQHQADTATITSPRMVITGVHKFPGASKAGYGALISDQ